MRYDHTSWLIHFVRDRIPEQDFPDEINSSSLLSDSELAFDAKAFSVLKTIIRLGGLYPGYSFRSGRTTIYGGKPAICATEMPIYSFATYAKSRDKSECVSAYGIAFLKNEFFEAGGRPVIYGLSTPDVKYKENNTFCRIFDESVLPLAEQYRYVAYNPSQDKWIDWSHEREWRWICNDDSDFVWCINADECYGGIPGLPLFSGKENEGHFSKLCIIVWTNEEAQEIRKLLTGFYFSESNNYDSPFSKSLIENSFIVVLETVMSKVENENILSYQTIEGLHRSDLITPIIIAEIPDNAEQIVESAFEKARVAGKNAAAAYKASHDIHHGYCGYAYAMTYEITNPLVQYMLQNDIASGPYDGRIHIYLDGEWEHSQSMDYNEHIYDAIAHRLDLKN